MSEKSRALGDAAGDAQSERYADDMASTNDRWAALRSREPFTSTDFARQAQGKWRDPPEGRKHRNSRPTTPKAAMHTNWRLQPSQIAVATEGNLSIRPGAAKRHTWSGSAIEDDADEQTNSTENDDPSTTMKPRFNSFPQSAEKSYRARYTVKSEKKTRNAVPWSNLHRGVIIFALDSGRPYVGQLLTDLLTDASDIVEINDRPRMFKKRCFLIIDRMDDHVSVRPICTHSGKGLRRAAEAIKKDSMCIFPFDAIDQEDWINEAEPNKVLYIKKQHSEGLVLASNASVRATQTMMLDRVEDFEVIAEMEESEVRKVEELEYRLKLESRREA